MSIFNPADILIPKNCDMTKWSVVACDQYTSQKEYWDKVASLTDKVPSTFNLIFPEAYLNSLNFEEKIQDINDSMVDYYEKGVFGEYKNALIFVKRTFKSGLVRHGLVGAVDLEKYDYSKDSTSNIRATEATVAERIPARVTIRRNASLELPHILLLIDDKKDAVLGELKNCSSEKIYDFDLMADGGHIEGYLVSDNEKVLSNLFSLGTNPLIAVGDGNHSLAGAKATWEEAKVNLTEEEKINHPLRYALCEIVNLYEDSLVFEPIYRVFFGADTEKLLDEMKKTSGKYSYTVPFETKDKKGEITFASDVHITSGAVTEFLEKYASENGGYIDYIHGEETAKTLGRNEGNIAFFPECLKKEELFDTVNTFGPLPKKTFSMGHAEEKRFYLEARRLRK